MEKNRFAQNDSVTGVNLFLFFLYIALLSYMLISCSSSNNSTSNNSNGEQPGWLQDDNSDNQSTNNTNNSTTQSNNSQTEPVNNSTNEAVILEGEISEADPSFAGNTEIIGTVTKSDGSPIEDVKVFVENGPSTTTLPNGMFYLTNVAPNERQLIKFFHKDYIPNQRPILAEADMSYSVDAVLIPFTKNVIENAENGGTFSYKFASKASTEIEIKVTFAEQGIAKSDGTIVTGNVDFYIGFMDVTDPQQLLGVPGDFLALIDTGESNGGPTFFDDYIGRTDQGLLQSFGMAQFELKIDDTDVNVAEGKTVTVEFEMVGGENFNDGDTIPLWEFNPENGFWEEKGTWTVRVEPDGRKFAVTELEHFSPPKNIDQLVGLNCVKGRVLQNEGATIAGVEVAVLDTVSRNLRTAYTANDGTFCINVTAGSTVTMQESAMIPGLIGREKQENIVINSRPAACGTQWENDCTIIPDITIFGIPTTCLIGSDADLADGTVELVDPVNQDSLDHFAHGNSNGTFCVPVVPAHSQVQVRGCGSIINVDTIGGSCSKGGCTTVARKNLSCANR